MIVELNVYAVMLARTLNPLFTATTYDSLR
jgi:hypothetical protein